MNDMRCFSMYGITIYGMSWGMFCIQAYEKHHIVTKGFQKLDRLKLIIIQRQYNKFKLPSNILNFPYNLTTYQPQPMSTQYTQLQAYQHLLQISQNILYSSQIQQQILHKYEQLKKSVLKKVLPVASQKQPHAMLLIYRQIMTHTTAVLNAFEQQLEGEMERKIYNQVVIQGNKLVEQKIKEVQALVEASSGKMRLRNKEQISAVRYQFDQLDGKFQNLGLLIQVHKKMHQIILQATRTEQRKATLENNLKDQIRELEEQLAEVGDVKAFLQQYKIAEDKLGEWKLANRQLKKVLFGGRE